MIQAHLPTFYNFGFINNEKDKHALFTRFYRVDKSRSREQGGTGLGLAIVKHICINNGFKIKLDSRLEEGSTFTIYFK